MNSGISGDISIGLTLQKVPKSYDFGALIYFLREVERDKIKASNTIENFTKLLLYYMPLFPIEK